MNITNELAIGLATEWANKPARRSWNYLTLLFVLLLSSCSMDELPRYAQQQPTLKVEQFFLGTLDAWGMFQQRNGQVVKRFHVVLVGKMLGRELVLDEQFVYDDGSKQQRIWRLTQAADGSWRGRADDVEGEAIGQVAGNTLNWRYTLLLPVDGKTYAMQMDDWMYLLDDNTMINRASMRKFGLEMGQVTLFFRRRAI